MKKKTPDFVISLGDKRTGERMCETLPPTLAGPIEVMSFLLFSSPRENGGDKGGQSKLTNGFSQPRKSYQQGGTECQGSNVKTWIYYND